MSAVKPTAKVTAATAAVAAVELGVALLEWLVPCDVPTAVEIPLAIVATGLAGWLAPRDRGGAHAAAE